MNKLTIKNKGDSDFLVNIDVNGIDFSEIARRAELIFEPFTIPVLKVYIPIWDIEVELLDSSVEPVNPDKFGSPVYFGDSDGKDETKTD